MTDLRTAAQEFVTDYENGDLGDLKHYARALRAALEQAFTSFIGGEHHQPLYPVTQPAAWTDRELELIDGMIEVQLRHAAQCDGIANRTMAEKQKGWDMERVALLQKIKSNPPRREPLSDEELDRLWREPMSADWEHREYARAVEAAHGIKENT